MPELDFLGHRLTAEEITQLVEKGAAVQEDPCPNTIWELMGYLGLVNFYYHFIPKAASIIISFTKANPRAAPAVLACPRGPRWASSNFQRGVLVPLHYGGLQQPLAGVGATEGYVC